MNPVETGVRPATSGAEDRAASQPIANYALLADCNSAALVDRGLDRVALPAAPTARPSFRGCSTRTPATGRSGRAGPTRARRYLPGTLVLETVFTTDSGSVRLRDAMAFAPGQRNHDLGYDAPHEVIRSVEGPRRRGRARDGLAAPEYGLVQPLFRAENGGGRTFGGPSRIAVSAGVPAEIEHATMRARFSVGEGDRVGFAMRWAPVEHRDAVGDPGGRGRRANRGHGRGVALMGGRARHLRGPRTRSSCASARGCSRAHRPTGAIVATTSLPRPSAGSATGTTATPGSATRA